MNVNSSEVVDIRPAVPTDVESLAVLSTQLGYPASPSDILRRLGFYPDHPDHALFVACIATPGSSVRTQVAGYIDLAVAHHLQSDPHVEIQGLVIDASARNRGIGVRLLERAESWARSHSIATIRVRSNVIREGAHRFYEREGYIREKTSAVFRKSVGGTSGADRS